MDLQHAIDLERTLTRLAARAVASHHFKLGLVNITVVPDEDKAYVEVFRNHGVPDPSTPEQRATIVLMGAIASSRPFRR